MTVPQVFEITLLAKADGGALTKQISLGPDGTIKSDGSACVMARGTARRARIGNVGELAGLINSMCSSEALTLGRLRQDFPDTVEVAPKRMLDQSNIATPPDVIAHTPSNIVYSPETAAFALLDFDANGMRGCGRLSRRARRLLRGAGNSHSRNGSRCKCAAPIHQRRPLSGRYR
jgi:hypothetical protein